MIIKTVKNYTENQYVTKVLYEFKLKLNTF